MKKEPVAYIVAFTTFIESIITFSVSMGLDWSSEQQGAVMAAVIAIGGVVTAFWARSKVTPV